MATFELAHILNHKQGKAFFDQFNIPYEVIAHGANKGKLKTKTLRSKDYQAVARAKEKISGYGWEELCDHANVFRDVNDNAVVTFSPSAQVDPGLIPWAEVSDIPLNGAGITIVIRPQKLTKA